MDSLVDRGQETSAKNMADALGTDRWNLIRYANEGITLSAADHLATKVLGIHPSLIWPEYWDLPDTKH